jgi:phosphoenolpyruvate carboxylase
MPPTGSPPTARKLVTLAPTIAALEKLAAASDDDTAQALLVAAAAMRADGLGMSWIHFRVNSSQLQNAIRRRIDPDGTLDLASQAALRKMRELLAEVKPLRSNFAALAIENSTAVRLFLTMAQILQHIDGNPDPHAGGRMRTAHHRAGRALFRQAVRGGGQG